MGMTINRRYRDALYDGLMTDLSAHSDIFTHLRNDETTEAKRLHNRFKGELRLLDDLGWEREPEAEQFELTMPPRELRPIIERVYWSAVASLNNEPDQLVDEALANLNEAIVACPEMLARLADEFMDGQQGRQRGGSGGVSATATRIHSPEELGQAIRTRRHELHLTQQTVADLTGVNRVVVGQLEHGKSTVQLRIVLLIVQVLGMDFELRVRG